MKLSLIVVGRMRNGPERQLLDDYLTRFERTGRGLGFGPVSVIEVEDKKNTGTRGEAVLLRNAIPKAAVLVALDERGKVISSPEFSQKLAGWRDQGQGHVAFVIGGADGIDAGLRNDADMLLSFGKMVWPHMLARVMLGEQLYRAASILAGAPYHRV